MSNGQDAHTSSRLNTAGGHALEWKPIPTSPENALACRLSRPDSWCFPAMAQFQFFDDTTSPSQGPAHVAKLRAEMARRGLDGFIVPRADEHQGEYVPRSAERLAWLTGFTGSGGTVGVFPGKGGPRGGGGHTVQAPGQGDN